MKEYTQMRAAEKEREANDIEELKRKKVWWTPCCHA